MSGLKEQLWQYEISPQITLKDLEEYKKEDYPKAWNVVMCRLTMPKGRLKSLNSFISAWLSAWLPSGNWVQLGALQYPNSDYFEPFYASTFDMEPYGTAKWVRVHHPKEDRPELKIFYKPKDWRMKECEDYLLYIKAENNQLYISMSEGYRIMWRALFNDPSNQFSGGIFTPRVNFTLEAWDFNINWGDLEMFDVDQLLLRTPNYEFLDWTHGWAMANFNIPPDEVGIEVVEKSPPRFKIGKGGKQIFRSIW